MAPISLIALIGLIALIALIVLISLIANIALLVLMAPITLIYLIVFRKGLKNKYKKVNRRFTLQTPPPSTHPPKSEPH